MNDLISRQDAINAANRADYRGLTLEDVKKVTDEVVKELKQLPSAPDVIRCKDCKYWQDQEDGVVEVPICARPENKLDRHPFIMIIGKDGFCSFADRRGEE